MEGDLNEVIPHVSSYAEGEVNRILNGVKGDAAFLAVPAIVDVKRNFEYESRRVIMLELHLVTLGEYYKCKRIPRGMRSRLRPTVFSENLEFKKMFESISDRYALDIILLNLDFLQKDLCAAKEKLREVEMNLGTMLSGEELGAYMEKTKGFLEKFKNDTMDIKKKKWHRDLGDYNRGRVYTWNYNEYNNGNTQGTTPRRGRKNKTQHEHVIDQSSFLVKDGLMEDSPPNISTRNQPEGVGAGDTGAAKTRSQKQGKIQFARQQKKKT
ncbi:uncharacterized protein LOC130368893 [Hyla sarda]|uniref:uncharacterized protein LOC130368891 n=1 Tax=Hyla sarda TaxID=327740 RepID=UPI0024C4188B|nr:uncharacterized protein LOC130368891 [Hyla sarda]XP_056429243.1 uncharacterized protein LOC130368892 [Hyla sarda]XP_056429244.1 uncharacterized protein LOC130368893 [Hyla sarda]